MLTALKKSVTNRAGCFSQRFVAISVIQLRQYANNKTKPKNFPPRKVIPEDEIQEAFIKGGGKGGQKINKTSSKVQLTHIPTGIVVNSQYTRSQLQNRKEARRILYDRVEQHLNPDHNRIDMILTWKKSLAKKSLAKKVKKYSKHKYEVILKKSDGIFGDIYSKILNDIIALRHQEEIKLKYGSQYSANQRDEFIDSIKLELSQSQQEYIAYLQAAMRNEIALLINALKSEKKPLDEDIFDFVDTEEDVEILDVKYGKFVDSHVDLIIYEANRMNMEDLFGTTNFTSEQGQEYMRRWSRTLTEHQQKLLLEFRCLHLIRVYNICTIDK
ncbi:hypothetical protein NADFUDRAFT_79531 [Nadsonia fulvescens var. elongata DSM 6958]|uniref:Prokaryotic-type class I peptide chain release factors domain-containing protein n=1 Tax=Nadsonia fulvescens var. elongata DSM 6958 TaxID=857566 RepID=A0A1E3PIF8_9ASCO|nr:hypothetical protein NADFUDRAFT_79531 [Nadsonia fulvescens var. elongata DSM 6958]